MSLFLVNMFCFFFLTTWKMFVEPLYHQQLLVSVRRKKGRLMLNYCYFAKKPENQPSCQPLFFEFRCAVASFLRSRDCLATTSHHGRVSPNWLQVVVRWNRSQRRLQYVNENIFAIALIASSLPRLPVICLECANLSADICQLLCKQ